MAGANADYAYGYCAEYANRLPDWEWIKSKRGYRKKLFKNTHLYVCPGKLTFGGGFAVSTGQSYVMVYNKYLTKVTKDILGIPFSAYKHNIASYYRDVKNIPPTDQPNYAHMVPKITPLYQNSRVGYILLSEFPTVLEHVFKRGKAIFDYELNCNSEVELLRSVILPESNLNRSKYWPQIILRLILNENMDNLMEKVKEEAASVGQYFTKERITKLERNADSILTNSPYVD